MTPEKNPLATYRVQFNPEFRFEDAHALVPYLSRLGVTHLYSSPVLRPRRDSPHGYDVVDPKTLNPQLGDEAEFRELSHALQAFEMGLILDIVPNHMAAGRENPYWLDVLTYGPASPYARWFDIDWRMPDPGLWGRVLVPILGEPLPRILENGQLRVEWTEGRFYIGYYEHLFPIDPATVPDICLSNLRDLENRLEPDHPALPELRGILTTLRALPRRAVRTRKKITIPRDETEQILSRLARVIENSPRIREWVEETCARFSEAEEGHDRLRRLLSRQCYRLVYWRRAARVLNYRRFFDINDLISVRQEVPEVFAETHSAVGRWIEEGLIDGLRVDHIDGLRDPQAYLQRLAELASSRQQQTRPFYIFVEKILARDESLPDDWPVAGTTGYDFLNQAEDVLLSADGFQEIEEEYRRILGRPVRFHQVVKWGKRRVLKGQLSAFVGRLAGTVMRLAESDERYTELTQRDYVNALIEVVVALPVYRTYVDSRKAEITPQDRGSLETALAEARREERASSLALDFLEEVLLMQHQQELPENEQQERLNFIQRFQQLTGPATAKGVEDTALYACAPLASRNEVGGEPDAALDDAPGHFDEANTERVRCWPQTMLGVTTHDTKRSADVRARLDVLSELPKLWFAHVQRWRRWNRRHRRRVRGALAPDINLEYLLYQTIVGLWPADDPRQPREKPPSAECLNELRERIEQYMLKAAREAKTRTSWVRQDQEFEDALLTFVRSLFLPPNVPESEFLSDVNQFAARIARPGYWNAIARTLIQLTSPGTPDIYQGDELWNFALVDPDNRRAVDFETRKQMLDDIITGFEAPVESRRQLVQQMVAAPEDGRIKLHTIRSVLQARLQNPALFASGDYIPLELPGEFCDHLCAFARVTDDRAALTLAPRLMTGLADDPAGAPIGEDAWKDAELRFPSRLQGLRWTSVLTGEPVDDSSTQEGTRLLLAHVFDSFPGALLVSEPAQSVPESEV